MLQVSSIFDAFVKTDLWPAFKGLGYKKSGNNFRFYDPAGWGKIIQLQKSQWNSKEELSFTVNIGLYLPEIMYAPYTKSTFTEPECIVRKRIGYLKSAQRDEWYELTANSNSAQLLAGVVNNFEQHVHPFLASIKSRDDIFAILVAGHKSDFPINQIRVMYEAGYHNAATDLLSSELASSKWNQAYRSGLRELANELQILLAS